MKTSKKQNFFGEKVIEFYRHFSVSEECLPSGVEILNPYAIPDIQAYMKAFCGKFFSDNKKRTFIFGINPGRLGGGATGVQFTDSVALQEDCGIENDLPKKRELSSHFVYKAIKQWGGVREFYDSFFLTAVFPVGLIRHGKNYNYYDSPKDLPKILDLIMENIRRQIQFGANKRSVVVLGTGKNQDIFKKVNDEHSFFETVFALEHPRYIMQYKRRELKKYLKKYRKVLFESSP